MGRRGRGGFKPKRFGVVKPLPVKDPLQRRRDEVAAQAAKKEEKK